MIGEASNHTQQAEDSYYEVTLSKTGEIAVLNNLYPTTLDSNHVREVKALLEDAAKEEICPHDNLEIAITGLTKHSIQYELVVYGDSKDEAKKAATPFYDAVRSGALQAKLSDALSAMRSKSIVTAAAVITIQRWWCRSRPVISKLTTTKPATKIAAVETPINTAENVMSAQDKDSSERFEEIDLDSFDQIINGSPVTPNSRVIQDETPGEIDSFVDQIMERIVEEQDNLTCTLCSSFSAYWGELESGFPALFT